MATNIKISDLKYGSNVKRNVFSALMDNLECESGNDIEVVGFRSKVNSFEISFHGDMENGHDLVVDDFGETQKGKWVQMDPTIAQRQEMQSALLNKVEDILREPEPIQYQENYGIYSDLY